jgi:hypothetical protein
MAHAHARTNFVSDYPSSMRAGKKGEFSPGERMFVCQLKLAGNNFTSIKRKFQERFGKLAPSRSGMKAMSVKLRTKFTVWDVR